MAKTVKFNLNLNGKSIRDIEGLQENFVIEEVLQYFNDGLLERWLKIREYDELYEQVVNITKSADSAEVASKLVEIFGIEVSGAKLEESVQIINYNNIKREYMVAYNKGEAKASSLLEDYYSGYEALIEHMVENAESLPILIADAKKLAKEYMNLFRYSYYLLYFELKETAPKAIYAFLSVPKPREYIFDREESNTDTIKNDIISIFSGKANVEKYLENEIIVDERNTEGNWDCIVEKGTKVMALCVYPATANIRNFGDRDERINAGEVRNSFPVLNGLEYQCNSNNSPKVIYVEV